MKALKLVAGFAGLPMAFTLPTGPTTERLEAFICRIRSSTSRRWFVDASLLVRTICSHLPICLGNGAHSLCMKGPIRRADSLGNLRDLGWAL